MDVAGKDVQLDPRIRSERERSDNRGADGGATTGVSMARALAEGKSVVEKLRDLAALRDDGIISSEEFEAKKAELLAAF